MNQDPAHYFQPSAEQRSALVGEQHQLLMKLGRLGNSAVDPVVSSADAQHYSLQLRDLCRASIFMGDYCEDAKERLERLTRGWRQEGIGPIRLLYYIQCLETVPNTEGFRFQRHDLYDRRPVNGSPQWLYFATHGYSDGFDAVEWLIRDGYLRWILSNFGRLEKMPNRVTPIWVELSWEMVEQAICKAFRQSLPETAKSRFEDVPDTPLFWGWKNDLEKWDVYDRVGKDFDAAAARFAATLSRHYGFDPMASVSRDVSGLRASLTPPDWARTATQGLGTYRTRSSPIIHAVLLAIYKVLWRNVPSPRMVLPTSPAFVARIAHKKANGRKRAKKVKGYEKKIFMEERANELWKLIADIVHHVSVCEGLPEPVSPLASRSERAYVLTWDEIKQRVEPYAPPAEILPTERPD